MIIYTYFNMRERCRKPENYIDRILFLSASNKLKVTFDEKADLIRKYQPKINIKNKELAKYIKHFLKEENWITFLRIIKREMI